jgi:hypothetical protein
VRRDEAERCGWIFGQHGQRLVASRAVGSAHLFASGHDEQTVMAEIEGLERLHPARSAYLRRRHDNDRSGDG